MMIKSIRLAAIILILILSGCSSGIIVLEKNKQLSMHRERIKKIVSLDPDFSKYKIGRKEAFSISLNEQFENRLTDNIKKIGKKSDIEIVIFDDRQLNESDIDFYNDIIPLKNAIISAVSKQSVVEAKEKGKFFRRLFGSIGSPKVVVWEDAPVISSEYSYMSEKYGTPYFSVQGVISIKYPNSLAFFWLFPPLGLLTELQNRNATYYYNIVVNVESTEVIYREFRMMYTTARPSNIDPILYDSFKLLQD